MKFSSGQVLTKTMTRILEMKLQNNVNARHYKSIIVIVLLAKRLGETGLARCWGVEDANVVLA